MLCHWIKHLKSLQAYSKLKFNFRSNYFGHNSHRHLKKKITPHTSWHMYMPHPHHINIQNITITWTCAHYSALITHSHLTFGKKKKNKFIFFFKPNTYNKRVRRKEIPASSGVDDKLINSERRGATGQALRFPIFLFHF